MWGIDWCNYFKNRSQNKKLWGFKTILYGKICHRNAWLVVMNFLKFQIFQGGILQIVLSYLAGSLSVRNRKKAPKSRKRKLTITLWKILRLWRRCFYRTLNQTNKTVYNFLSEKKIRIALSYLLNKLLTFIKRQTDLKTL